ncbi:DHA2 family efflux MFS transporter permease subunit [Pistricoccus aurantiacus]|uniref:DHA2 family efflux MFS transporter permease subunit n=1 Tax=Pistricoccus aurantiacus TaxID=1883414 RepID=A0A5B8SPF9_9GAMM|nr:DHA2 family efflux MFS transporter permease subunit [Pistricoccus aurantiacus]QEA38979.1 DHA2 family efflux MFS transporter permease subunit [Pistricoccus aurantiacus]
MANEASLDTLPPLSGGRLIGATIVLALAVFMNVLDVSIANVSIPTIAGDLAVSASQGTWIITVFAVCNAVTVPISGWLSRRFGQVRLFVFCTLLFTLFSWLCGFASNFELLLTFRGLQGAAAGPMIPISQSLLLACYPREKRGLANGIYGMTAVVGPIAGPILGGWITDHINWSWIFYINVPVGLIVAPACWLLLKDRETPVRREGVDLVGLVLLIIGVGSLQVMLDQGAEKAWFQSDYIITLSVVAAIFLCVLVIWEWTAERPIIDIHLFRDRNFAVGTILLCLGYMVFFGAIVILPLWLQTGMGYTATWAGMATASMGILGVVASPLAGRLSDKVDARYLVTFGFFVFASVSFYNSHANPFITFEQIFLPRLPWGIGTAFFFIPLMAIAFSRLPTSELAGASALLNFLRQLFLGFGTSFATTLWDDRATFHDHRLNSHLTPFDPATHQWLQRLQDQGLSLEQAQRLLANEVSHQALIMSTNDVFYVSGWIFAALMLVVWLAKSTQEESAAATAQAH